MAAADDAYRQGSRLSVGGGRTLGEGAVPQDLHVAESLEGGIVLHLDRIEQGTVRLAEAHRALQQRSAGKSSMSSLGLAAIGMVLGGVLTGLMMWFTLL
jgi:hypothetical protein